MRSTTTSPIVSTRARGTRRAERAPPRASRCAGAAFEPHPRRLIARHSASPAPPRVARARRADARTVPRCPPPRATSSDGSRRRTDGRPFDRPGAPSSPISSTRASPRAIATPPSRARAWTPISTSARSAAISARARRRAGDDEDVSSCSWTSGATRRATRGRIEATRGVDVRAVDGACE